MLNSNKIRFLAFYVNLCFKYKKNIYLKFIYKFGANIKISLRSIVKFDQKKDNQNLTHAHIAILISNLCTLIVGSRGTFFMSVILTVVLHLPTTLHCL